MPDDRLKDEIASRMAAVGALVRQARKAAGLTIDDVSALTGVGRRFVHDLETGKPTVEFGRAIVVAEAVGIRMMDALARAAAPEAAGPDPEGPDMPDEGYGDEPPTPRM